MTNVRAALLYHNPITRHAVTIINSDIKLKTNALMTSTVGSIKSTARKSADAVHATIKSESQK